MQTLSLFQAAAIPGDVRLDERGRLRFTIRLGPLDVQITHSAISTFLNHAP